jgi:hypothetical protein
LANSLLVNYYRVLLKLSSGSSEDGAMLVCDDKIWQWVTTLGEIGLNPPDQLISQVMNSDRKKFPSLLSFYISYYYPELTQKKKKKNLAITNPGYYWTHYLPDSLSTWSGIRKPDGTPGGDLCTGNLNENRVLGWTWPSDKLIMMCPSAFIQSGTTQRRRALLDLISGQADIPSGTHLDSLQTSSAVFLHEMMHWIGQGSKYIGMCKITFHHADYF